MRKMTCQLCGKEYRRKVSDGVERGKFPPLEMIERISQYLQIDLNNLPRSLCVNKKNLRWRNSLF